MLPTHSAHAWPEARSMALAAGVLTLAAAVAAAVQVERGVRLLDGEHRHLLR